MSKQLYLLTGGTGFLGSHILHQLRDRGDCVRVFTLPGDPAVKWLPDDVDICYGDLTSAEDVERFFTVPAGTQTVCIHCASMVTVNPDFSQKLVDVNVGGATNIVNAAKAHPECEKLVYVSSTGAIPEQPRPARIAETDDFDPDKVVGWYSRTKAMATEVVLDAAKEGLNACVVHPSGILGPEDHAVSETTGTIVQIIKGEMPMGMQGSFNLCDVRDLAAGCIGAADKGRAGECYILANEEVTLKEMCGMLHDELGCKGPVLYLPLGLAGALARGMERRAKKKGTKPVLTTFSVYNLERNNAFDYSKAQRELGYKTRPYAETLRDEAAWLKEEGLV